METTVTVCRLYYDCVQATVTVCRLLWLCAGNCDCVQATVTVYRLLWLFAGYCDCVQATVAVFRLLYNCVQANAWVAVHIRRLPYLCIGDNVPVHRILYLCTRYCSCALTTLPVCSIATQVGSALTVWHQFGLNCLSRARHWRVKKVRVAPVAPLWTPLRHGDLGNGIYLRESQLTRHNAIALCGLVYSVCLFYTSKFI